MPGTSAIRAGGRIIFLLLPLYSYYLAYFITWFFEKEKSIANKFINFAVIFLILLELISLYEYNFEKNEDYQKRNLYPIQNCNIISFDHEKNEDANINNTNDINIMWYSLNNNIYTANGFSGYTPNIKKNIVPNNCRFQWVEY